MKVALVHDYLKEYGGAERVLEALHDIWPKAPVFTLTYLPSFLGPHQGRFKDWDIRPLLPRWLPTAKLISPLRLLAPLLFKKLDLTGYDLVIVSATGAYNPNLVKTKPGAHFCYCHTPPRYLYGLPTSREWKKHWWIRWPAEVANHFLRMIDFESAQKVDQFLTNSRNTARRVKKFYRREAVVVYPPVEIPGKEKLKDGQKGGHFLAGGRLARAKRIDLIIKACNQLKLSLKVFGRAFADYGEELQRMAGPTVEFLGEVSDQEKDRLYRDCLAFVFAAEEEDFGIMPVEAMGFGKPVIALAQGGVLESVVEGKTGLFFREPTVESLVKVLRSFKVSRLRAADCRRQAQKFNRKKFQEGIKKVIKNA